MDIFEAIEQRHSVRRYIDKEIETDKLDKIQGLISEYNNAGGLDIQMVLDEPSAFEKQSAFSNVKNYIVLAGPSGEFLDELCGYFGEKLVLEIQMLGLNTCWVKLACRAAAKHVQLKAGEKIVCVIAFGYGENQGRKHRNRPVDDVIRAHMGMPQWYLDGAYCALKGPSAMNQQVYYFKEKDGVVEAGTPLRFWPCALIDLGIARYHFELGAGTGNFKWKNPLPFKE